MPLKLHTGLVANNVRGLITILRSFLLIQIQHCSIQNSKIQDIVSVYTIIIIFMVPSIKSIAVIGAGPSGAITLDALTKEGTFDVIRVFERNDQAGGMWYVDFTKREFLFLYQNLVSWFENCFYFTAD